MLWRQPIGQLYNTDSAGRSTYNKQAINSLQYKFPITIDVDDINTPGMRDANDAARHLDKFIIQSRIVLDPKTNVPEQTLKNFQIQLI